MNAGRRDTSTGPCQARRVVPPSNQGGLRAWWIAAFGLLGAIAVAFSDVLGPGRGLFFRDHVLVFRPRAAGLVDAISAGRWPGLTRASPIGVPLEMQLNGTWTPPSTLLFLGDVDVVYDLMVIALFAILAIGVLRFACALGATPLVAVVAAGVAALGGPVIANENLVVNIQGLVWVPWIGLGLVSIARSESGSAVAATAIAIGFHLQSILPVVLVLDMVFVGVLAAHLRPGRRAIALAVAAGVWGVGIAALEIMPLVTVLGETARGQGFAYEAQSGWALNPAMGAEFWVPSFWAPPEVPVLNAPFATGNASDPPYFGHLYLGSVIPLVLAGGAKRPIQRGLWIVVAVALVVALGRHTPVHRWVASLPLLSSSRYAIKYTMVMAAALAALSALAMPVVIKSPRRLVAWAIAQCGLLATGWMIVASPEYRDALEWIVVPLQIGIVFEDLQLREAMLEGQLARLAFATAMAAVLALSALAVAVWGRRAAPAVAVVVVIDLAVGATFSIRGANVEDKRLPEAPRAILGGGHQRFVIEHGGRQPPVAHADGQTRFEDLMRSLGRRGHHSYRTGRLAVSSDLDGLGHSIHVAAMDWALTAPRPEAYRMLARLGVAWIVSPQGDLPLPLALSWPVPGEPPQHIYRLDGVRPYVSAFNAWTVVPPSALNATGHRRHLLNPANHAVVTAGASESRRGTCTPEAFEWTVSSPERIYGRVDAQCALLVVVQETAAPGWAVTIDGVPATLAEAEAGYMAAVVPPGSHRFEFRFRHRSKSWAMLSGLAFTAAILALLAPHFRGRRRREGERSG